MDHRIACDLVDRLNRDAKRIARRFDLQYESIRSERANVKNRYGVCDSDGGIKIRLRHAVSGAALKYSSLVNTLCHELAHLRHFNHGERFKAFYLQLLEFARAEGIYRPGLARGDRRSSPAARIRPPGRRRLTGPIQLGLFPEAPDLKPIVPKRGAGS